MRRLLFGIVAVCLWAASANAAAICATPQEKKVLQAAALRQQLAAAAQSCHYTADYSRFVATFGRAIVKSDRALKEFFHRRKSGEGYSAYKARIAETVSLRSLHDPRFCQSAKIVFDLALKRDGAAQEPSLVQTGYERCRPLPAKPVVASNSLPRVPARTVTYSISKTAAPAVAGEVPRAAPVGHVQVAAPGPGRSTRSGTSKPAASKPPVLVTSAPRTEMPKVLVPPPPAAEPVEDTPPVQMEDDAAPDLASPDEAEQEPAFEQAQADDKPYGAIDRRLPNRTMNHPGYDPRADSEADDPYSDGDDVPNAYKPGAYWVSDDDPPRLSAMRHPPQTRVVMGPDGRWYPIRPNRPVWSDE
jgi:hypothetical protein